MEEYYAWLELQVVTDEEKRKRKGKIARTKIPINTG